MIRPLRSIGACAIATTLAGCAVSVEDLPLPAPGVSGPSYQLDAVFTNALNLPDRAKVRVGGADVGEVVAMTARDYTAVVSMRVLDSVELPVGTQAELRSATPLGDIFVSLVPPTGDTGGGLLRDGDTIAVEATVAAATVEDVLASTSLLVNGGVIGNLTRVLNGMGDAMNDGGERLTALIADSRHLLATMAARSDDLRGVLAQTAALADALDARRGAINDILGSAAPALAVIADNTVQIVTLADQVAAVTRQLERFPSIQGTDTRSIIHDMNMLAGAFNESAVDPRVTMANLLRILPPTLKFFSANAAHSDVELRQVVLGPVDDPGHLADPEFRVPESADWANLVGSLAFVLTQLGNRVMGPGR
ncbi:MCE family protein [Nocardia uniformis]|uniref:MCE family protein n=1 Tax=Nocardia uniformis TaxID=53432 RepID=A0A849BW73_9NOCA|nr:MlaD family protein [Nocardia uniformis]NNH68540.1 MCE family protein [Nocardia uniformis]